MWELVTYAVGALVVAIIVLRDARKPALQSKPADPLAECSCSAM